MQTTGRTSGSANEQSLELKYCERCGGLWLRPAGGGQIYCTDCARAMAELPRPSDEPDNEIPRDPLWDGDDGYDEGYLVNIIDLDGDLDSDLDTKEERHEWIN